MFMGAGTAVTTTTQPGTQFPNNDTSNGPRVSTPFQLAYNEGGVKHVASFQLMGGSNLTDAGNATCDLTAQATVSQN
jgi:hypothetical protein